MAKKRSGVAKLKAAKKSEVVTVRLDPRLKYLAELAARKQRRPLSGFIEWAVQQSLDSVILEDHPLDQPPVSLSGADRICSLWDVDEADRVAKLALHYPGLLTYEEQLLWKLVRSNGSLWNQKFHTGDRVWRWKVEESNLNWERLRANWDTFKKVAAGDLPPEKLPDWERTVPLLV